MRAEDDRHGVGAASITRPTRHVAGATFIALIAALIVALLGLLAPPASASPLLHSQTRVAAIAEPAGQLVGPHKTVLPAEGRPRAPSYDRTATGSCFGAEGDSAAAQAAASTGRMEASNLTEQLAMEAAQSDPAAGRVLPITMTDARWPAADGWVKMAQNISGVEIHYVYNTVTGVSADFKFVP